SRPLARSLRQYGPEAKAPRPPGPGALSGQPGEHIENRYAENGGSMSTRIEDYGIIGNTYTAALVSREGSIDWLCLPRFDSESVFAALRGDPEHGRGLITPTDPLVQLSRRYRGETGILETRFETAEG